MFKVLFMNQATDFLQNISQPAREKVAYNISRIQKGERNAELFKKLEGSEIWEFRTLYDKVCYRLFAFWDTDSDAIIVATHGLVKKTQKTPSKEIAKAEALRKEYFNYKRNELWKK